ncbi:MAG TPA: hypothetical protein PLW31_11060 [Bacteroidales bacterium]|nr:hypothetical protein [Bacteroidales bacterium]HPI86019.1 hypothetical protein [Bacteroidales bacterium]HPM93520.1 hypothetical protein [Bacteroidales bacterium]
MKTAKLFFFVICILAWAGINETFAQWGVNGSHIYNTNAGNVGIGNNSPTTLLHVQKLMTEPTITIQNLGGTGGATYTMIDNASGANWKFKATLSGGFKIRDHANSLDVVVIEPNSAANSLYINSSGFIGIGTNAPAQKLTVFGGDFKIDDYYPFIFLNNTSTGGNMGITFWQAGEYRAWLYYDDGESLLRLNAEQGGGSRNDLVILNSGSVCLGTTTEATGYRLNVDGKVICTEVRVEALANWPDYVFGDNYRLMTLAELEQNIKSNGHLPGLPSASHVEANGFELGNMQRILLEKIEELTLYTIEQNKQITELQKKVSDLEKAGRK